MAVQPLPAAFVFLLLGLALMLFTKRRKNGLACLAAGTLVLFVSSFPPLVRWSAGFLESRYPPLAEFESEPPDFHAIVVLGNLVAHPGDASLPALSRLGDAARARLAEGVRLSRIFPRALLVTCGYGLGLENCADVMALAAVELGVDEGRIRRLGEGMDTEHEVRLVRDLAFGRPVIVVTTATHMPRAMLLFERAGVDATAAPCDFIRPPSPEVLGTANRRRWRPRGASLADSEELWHELLGLAYYGWFRGAE